MGALRTYAKPERETDATSVSSTPTAEAGALTHGRHHDPAAFLRLVSPGGTVSPSQRAGAFHNAQQHYGNRAVQRFMASTPVIQRKCACGGSCSSCMDEEETKLQRA